jgi:hypothetical protein
MPRKSRQYGRTAHKKRLRKRHGKQKRAERSKAIEKYQANPIFKKE